MTKLRLNFATAGRQQTIADPVWLAFLGMFGQLRSLTLFGISVESPKDYFLPHVLGGMPLL